MFLLLAIILTLTPQIWTQTPSSPCPHIFTYETRNTNEPDRWYGILTIQTNEDLTGVWIHIILDRPALQLGNWFGNTTNVDNREFIIRHPKYRLEAGPPITIRFFVIYNPEGAVPSVRNIRLNGKTICGVEFVEATTEATLHLSEIRLNLNENSDRGSNNNIRNSNNKQQDRAPPGQNKRPVHSYNNNGNRNDNKPNDRSPTTTTNTNNGNRNDNKPNNRSPTTTTTNYGNRNENRPIDRFSTTTQRTTTNGLSVEDPNNNGFDFFPGDFSVNQQSFNRPIQQILPIETIKKQHECGRIAIQPTPLISYGQNTTKGQYPWHAALYHSRGAQLMYTCGGTLITDKHVLTAAHCTAKPQTNNAINPQDLLVYLGKYNLKKFGPEVQDVDVSDIFIHPQYNYSNLFNDIAILKLSRSAQIGDFVRPCCLWDDTDRRNIELDSIIGQVGVVVGWGFNEDRELSNDLMQTEMPIVSTVKCIYSNREFFSRFTFEKNFCAGYHNGTSVCNGDSGGGLILPKPNTNGRDRIWQIRGIVSVGVALQGYGVCDPQHYAVFTDVAKHLDWIRNVINKN